MARSCRAISGLRVETALSTLETGLFLQMGGAIDEEVGNYQGQPVLIQQSNPEIRAACRGEERFPFVSVEGDSVL